MMKPLQMWLSMYVVVNATKEENYIQTMKTSIFSTSLKREIHFESQGDTFSRFW